MGCLRQMGWAVIEGHRETSGSSSSTIHRGARSREISVIRLRENLEVLAVDKIEIVYQEIACVLHFASDLFLSDSVTEEPRNESSRMKIENRDATAGP